MSDLETYINKVEIDINKKLKIINFFKECQTSLEFNKNVLANLYARSNDMVYRDKLETLYKSLTPLVDKTREYLNNNKV